jgi:hypothetical protein
MKKNHKKVAANNQEDENFKVYVLYPENAIEDTNHKKQLIKKPGFPTALKGKQLNNVISINKHNPNLE